MRGSLAVIVLCFPILSAAQSVEGEGPRFAQVEGSFARPATGESGNIRKRVSRTDVPARVVLEKVEQSRVQREIHNFPQALSGVPLKIGFSRPVAEFVDEVQTASSMVWTREGSRKFASISLTSPDALGIRLGLHITKVPPSAMLRFFVHGDTEVFEVTGQTVMETIVRNRVAGDISDDAQTYWSPVILGPEITIEVDLPESLPDSALQFSIPKVSHLYSSPIGTRALVEKIGQSASCHVDSQCYQSAWSNESSAIAKMVFSDSGSSYVCSGTLLNDMDTTSSIPYFLSANHCIADQTVASSLQTYWFYWASSCNSGILSANTRTLSGGATLLYASEVTDTSFMQLNGTPPSGAYFAGWSTDLQSLSTTITGVHHPKGDLQKASFGAITGYSACTPGSQGFQCTSSASGAGNHLRVGWNLGITEGGSSGSGLWATSGTSRYLVGQLHGGSSTCTSPTSSDFYGRLDLAYATALHQWLGAAAPSNVPSTPTIDAVVAGDAQISISFKPGSVGSGTLIDYTGNCSSDDVKYTVAKGSASPVVVTGLTNGLTYHCWVKTNSSIGSSPWSAQSVSVTPSNTVTATRLINLATRGFVQTGDNVMIGGFIISGTAPQTVLIRARGPDLANYGVPGALANPTLSLYSGQTVVASNDDWGTANNAAAIQSSGLAPANALESAILTTLQPGAYTVIVSGVGGGTGVGIVEVFAR